MRKFGKAVLIFFISLIILIVIANLAYDPPPDSGKSQREIEGEIIGKANALAKKLMDANIVHSVKGTKILVFAKKWNKLPERERLDFVRTWGRAKKMAQNFEGRIEVNSYLDDFGGYPPFMYYDVDEDEFIYTKKQFYEKVTRVAFFLFIHT